MVGAQLDTLSAGLTCSVKGGKVYEKSLENPGKKANSQGKVGRKTVKSRIQRKKDFFRKGQSKEHMFQRDPPA